MTKVKSFNLKQGIKEIKKLINELSKKRQCVIVAVAGGSGSGKGYVSKVISKTVDGKILSMDNYYVGIENMKDENFDSPDAIDLKLLREHIKLLKQNKKIKKPIYDYKTHHRIGYETLSPSRVIVFEGLFALSDIFRKEVDIRIFVDASEKIKLKRRIDRDFIERGRLEEETIKQWNKTVKPMYEKYVEPQKKHADIIIINE